MVVLLDLMSVVLKVVPMVVYSAEMTVKMLVEHLAVRMAV